MASRAQFVLEVDQNYLAGLTDAQIKDFFSKDAAIGLFKAFDVARSVPAPAAVPRDGSVGCSATVSTGGQGSVSCGATWHF